MEVGVHDLSHQYGTYVKSNDPCILTYNVADGFNPDNWDMDSEEIGNGWNLLSPYDGDLSNSEKFGWIDYESTGIQNIFSTPNSISSLECDSVSACKKEDGQDGNAFDAYWVENQVE